MELFMPIEIFNQNGPINVIKTWLHFQYFFREWKEIIKPGIVPVEAKRLRLRQGFIS